MWKYAEGERWITCKGPDLKEGKVVYTNPLGGAKERRMKQESDRGRFKDSGMESCEGAGATTGCH